MISLDDRVTRKIHETIRSMYKTGAIEWIEQRYAEERNDLSENLDKALCQFSLKHLSEHELRQIASQYLSKHMRWLLEFRQNQKRLAS